MRRSGIPGSQIAALLGVTRHAIYHRLEKFPEYKALRESEKSQQARTEEEITSQLSSGLTTNDIIDLHGWTRPKVDSWLHRRGISVARSHFTFDEEAAWRAFTAGESTQKIAERFGVYRRAVVRSFERYHFTEYKRIVANRKGGRKEGTRLGNKFNVERAFNEYKAGDSIYVLGKRYKITPGTAAAAFRAHYGEEYKALAAERLEQHRITGARWHRERRTWYRGSA